MNKGNEFNNSYLRGLTGKPVSKPKRIIDEVIDTASADPGIVVVSEDPALVNYRASGDGMTLKGDPLIAALRNAGVNWPTGGGEEVVEAVVPRVEPVAPVVETVVTEDVPLRHTGNSIFEKIVNGERWELKDGRWQSALPTEEEVYGTNVNYDDYDPVAEGDVDGPRTILAENAADYGTPRTTIIEQIAAGPPANWKDTRLPEAATQRRRGTLSARFMTDAAREALASPRAEGIMAAVMEGRQAGAQDAGRSLVEQRYGISPDAIPYYEQPVEIEMAQVMPENVPQRPSARSMILDDLRQQALNNIDRLGADDMRMGPMLGNIPADRIQVMSVNGDQEPTARAMILDNLRQKALDQIDGLAADDMRMGPMLGNIPADRIRIMPMEAPQRPTYKSMILEDLRQKALDDMNRVPVDDIPVEALIEDADNPRLAGALLQDPRVRLGLAGAGGAGLLAVIAHNVGQNREARRQEAQRNLNYPMGY